MNSFFRTFFASLLALLVFSILVFFITVGMVGIFLSPSKPEIGQQAVLVLDLSQQYPEIAVENPLASLNKNDPYEHPSLFDVVRLIKHAGTDSDIKGILLKCGGNANGLGNSEDIRQALADFKSSGKFVYAYADAISQGAYFIANIADKIYCNPQGGVDWRGYVMQYFFLKGTLDKLEIEPQIFYAGKFKSATEPFRTTRMTDANRLQSTVILNDLYSHFLEETAAARSLDTATLHRLAVESSIRSAADAVNAGLIDGALYEDQVRDRIREKLGLDKQSAINFVSVGKYAEAVNLRTFSGGKIAILYAAGDVVVGRGDRNLIGSETYVDLLRKMRRDRSIKAVVVRINSGGGSSMASEDIWREMSLCRQEKPVVVSYGDVAASGAYYLSCNADSIFAQPNTITGSIGVFSIFPNMQKFFNNKLGITFDQVKTAPDADALSISKPLTESQKRMLQADVDSIYLTFTKRVAEGRSRAVSYIDSIGQGRIWSGTRALSLGLVDRIGGLNDAIACAARMAKLETYSLREYPQPKSVFDLLLGGYKEDSKVAAMQEELGPEGWRTYQTLHWLKSALGKPQARLPYQISIR